MLPNHVVAQASGRLAAVPFSLRDLRVTGAASIVLENVWQGTGGAMGFAVADDGVLLYHSRHGGESGVNRLVVVSPQGAERQLPSNAVNAFFPRASPDGKHIILSDGDLASGGSTLIDAATGARDVLARAGDGVRGEWTRDGRRVVMLRLTSRAMEFVSRAVDRGSPDTVLGRDTLHTMATISLGPPGGWAAFLGIARGRTGADDLFMAPMESLSAVRPLVASTVREWSPSVSPDGKFVAYASDESSSFQVYVLPLPGPGARLRVSTNGGSEPHWSADSRTIYFRGVSGFRRATLDAARREVVRVDQLFADSYDRSSFGGRDWDVLPNGEFLMIAVPASSGRVQAVVQWQSLLKK